MKAIARRLLRQHLVLLTVLVASTSIFADDPGLSLEETVGLKTASNALMSPNGDAVAYILSVPRQPYVDADGSAFKKLHMRALVLIIVVVLR